MTDNDIIKILEYCVTDGWCSDCPHEKKCIEDEITALALKLIKAQKAEIEKLREHIELLDIEHEAIKISAVKDFAERFKSKAWVDKTLLGYPYYNISFRTFNNLVKERVGDD